MFVPGRRSAFDQVIFISVRYLIPHSTQIVTSPCTPRSYSPFITSTGVSDISMVVMITCKSMKVLSAAVTEARDQHVCLKVMKFRKGRLSIALCISSLAILNAACCLFILSCAWTPQVFYFLYSMGPYRVIPHQCDQNVRVMADLIHFECIQVSSNGLKVIKCE